MPIRAACPNGHVVVVPEEAAGKTLRCSLCKTTFQLGMPAPSTSVMPPENPPSTQSQRPAVSGRSSRVRLVDEPQLPPVAPTYREPPSPPPAHAPAPPAHPPAQPRTPSGRRRRSRRREKSTALSLVSWGLTIEMVRIAVAGVFLLSSMSAVIFPSVGVFGIAVVLLASLLGVVSRVLCVAGSRVTGGSALIILSFGVELAIILTAVLGVYVRIFAATPVIGVIICALLSVLVWLLWMMWLRHLAGYLDEDGDEELVDDALKAGLKLFLAYPLLILIVFACLLAPVRLLAPLLTLVASIAFFCLLGIYLMKYFTMLIELQKSIANLGVGLEDALTGLGVDDGGPAPARSRDSRAAEAGLRRRLKGRDGRPRSNPALAILIGGGVGLALVIVLGIFIAFAYVVPRLPKPMPTEVRQKRDAFIGQYGSNKVLMVEFTGVNHTPNGYKGLGILWGRAYERVRKPNVSFYGTSSQRGCYYCLAGPNCPEPQEMIDQIDFGWASVSWSDPRHIMVWVNSSKLAEAEKADPDPAPGPIPPRAADPPAAKESKPTPADPISAALAKLDSRFPDERNQGLDTLEKMRPSERRQEVTQAIVRFLNDRSSEGHALRAYVVWADERDAKAKLLENIRSPNPFGKGDNYKLLATFKDTGTLPVLAEGLLNAFDHGAAVEALVSFGPGAEPEMLKWLTHQNADGRKRACEVLKKIGTVASLPALEKLAGAANEPASGAAKDAIKVIEEREGAK